MKSKASRNIIASLAIAVSFFIGTVRSAQAQTPGTIWAWGLNADGELGSGTSGSSSVPVQTSDLTGVTKAVTGNASKFSMGITRDGSLWAWGGNYSGELGNGTVVWAYNPVKVSSLTQVVGVATGGDYGDDSGHTLAIRSDGSVWATGSNSWGQLGNGAIPIGGGSLLPVKVDYLTGISSVSASFDFSTALKSDGTVWAWGRNDQGQLGNLAASAGATPTQVYNLTNVVAISDGYTYSLALKSDGTVWGWGNNDSSELGATGNTAIPVQVNGISGVAAIAAGGNHSLALRTDGTVWAWGDNQYGELGNGTFSPAVGGGPWPTVRTPAQVLNLSNVVAIGAGLNFSIALKKNGTVWAWGTNRLGQLGNGTGGDGTENFDSNIPVQVTGLTNIASISAGQQHVLAVQGAVSPVRSISVAPATASAAVGAADALRVVATYRDGTTQDVSTDSATLYTITHGVGSLSGNHYTSTRPEAAVIAVSYSAGGATVYGAAYITETYPHGLIASSTFTPASSTVTYSTPVTFAFTVTYADGTTADVSTNAATTYTLQHGVGTLSGNTYTSTRAEAAVITAAYVDAVTGQSINKAGYITETAPPTLTGITVTPSSPSVAVGSTVTFTVTAHFADGTSSDITGSASYSVPPGYGTGLGNLFTPSIAANAPITISYVVGRVTKTVLVYVRAH